MTKRQLLAAACGLFKQAAEPPSLGRAIGEVPQAVQRGVTGAKNIASQAAKPPLGRTIFDGLWGGNKPGTLFGPSTAGNQPAQPMVDAFDIATGGSNHGRPGFTPAQKRNNMEYGQPNSPGFTRELDNYLSDNRLQHQYSEPVIPGHGPPPNLIPYDPRLPPQVHLSR